MSERPRVLQMGPDPTIGGGMAAVLRGLLSSPLARSYELDVVPTYRGTAPLGRLLLFCLALARLGTWSLAGRGRIVHVHSTVRGSAYRKSVCVLLAKALRRRVVLHVHSGAGDIAAFAGGRDRLSLAFFRAAFAAADVVLAVSAASARALEGAYGIAGVEVVPNAAPAVAAFERQSPADGVRAAYVGGFANPAKGGDVLLEALARGGGDGLAMTMAGPGELPAAGAELLAGRPGLEWVGWLGPEEKDALFRRAEVFVMPSRSEGLPMALLEAMAYGMAVVASAAGGIPEVVEDGVDGCLVEPEDPAALAAALRDLGADAAMRERFAAAARRRSEEFGEAEVSRRLAAIYASLL
jgi:glycosyltransferase involved in cell wall biosynthesis